MAAKRKPLPFEPTGSPAGGPSGASGSGAKAQGSRASGGSKASTGKKAAGAKRASSESGVARSAAGARSTGGSKSTGGARSTGGASVIPKAVANRMALRIAIATGVPSLLGMAVFVASYLLVSRGVLDIPPVLTLAASGGCFLLGVLGLSYGVLSASWEEGPGSKLGFEQIGVNIQRVRASIKAMGRAGTTPPAG